MGNIIVQSSADSYTAGQEVTVTFSLGSGITASSGAVELSAPEGVTILSGDWLINSPTLQIFDMKTNKGAFSYSSEETVSSEVFKLTFKTSSAIQKSMNVRLEFRDDSSTVLNETVAINVDSTGQKIEPTKEVTDETITGPVISDDETKIISDNSSSETHLETNENGETIVVDAEGNVVAQVATQTESGTLVADATSSQGGNGPGLYIALGVVVAVIVAAVVICFTRKKHKTKQEDNPND